MEVNFYWNRDTFKSLNADHYFNLSELLRLQKYLKEKTHVIYGESLDIWTPQISKIKVIFLIISSVFAPFPSSPHNKVFDEQRSDDQNVSLDPHWQQEFWKAKKQIVVGVYIFLLNLILYFSFPTPVTPEETCIPKSKI